VTARLTGRRPVLLLTLLGALLILLAGTRTWATVTLAGSFLGLSELTVSGRGAAPAVIAIALAVGAAVIVLAVSGRVVRLLVAAGLVIAGAVVVVTGVRFARDPGRAVVLALRDSLHVATGSSSWSGGTAVDFSIWPWAAAIGGALVLLAGLLGVIGGRSWSGPARRYERATGSPGSGPAGSAGPGASAGSNTGADPAVSVAPAATWDALSRGEDPTSSPEDQT